MVKLAGGGMETGSRGTGVRGEGIGVVEMHVGGESLALNVSRYRALCSALTAAGSEVAAP